MWSIMIGSDEAIEGMEMELLCRSGRYENQGLVWVWSAVLCYYAAMRVYTSPDWCDTISNVYCLNQGRRQGPKER